MLVCCHTVSVSHVVGVIIMVFIIASILIYAAMEESAYVTVVHPVVITSFMIHIPIYVAMEN